MLEKKSLFEILDFDEPNYKALRIICQPFKKLRLIRLKLRYNEWRSNKGDLKTSDSELLLNDIVLTNK